MKNSETRHPTPVLSPFDPSAPVKRGEGDIVPASRNGSAGGTNQTHTCPERDLNYLRNKSVSLVLWLMKFAAAILVFFLFAFFIGWGIVELLKGRPWLLIATMGVFIGTFAKYGCLTH